MICSFCPFESPDASRLGLHTMDKHPEMIRHPLPAFTTSDEDRDAQLVDILETYHTDRKSNVMAAATAIKRLYGEDV